MYNDHVDNGICRAAAEQGYLVQYGEGGEVIFVHEGEGVLETIFGDVPYGRHDYLVIPRGTTYRLRFDDARHLPAKYHDLFGATIVWVVVSSLVVFTLFRLEQKQWRYTGSRDLLAIGQAVVVALLERLEPAGGKHLAEPLNELGAEVRALRGVLELPAQQWLLFPWVPVGVVWCGVILSSARGSSWRRLRGRRWC